MPVFGKLDGRRGVSELRVYNPERAKKDHPFAGCAAYAPVNILSSHRDSYRDEDEAPMREGAFGGWEVHSESGDRRQKTSGSVRAMESIRRANPAMGWPGSSAEIGTGEGMEVA